VRGASGHQHHCSRADEPERRIHPAGLPGARSLPDESGVPVVVSRCAREQRPETSPPRGDRQPGSGLICGRSRGNSGSTCASRGARAGAPEPVPAAVQRLSMFLWPPAAWQRVWLISPSPERMSRTLAQLPGPEQAEHLAKTALQPGRGGVKVAEMKQKLPSSGRSRLDNTPKRIVRQHYVQHHFKEATQRL
jgi:hypothetical protein